MQYQYSTCAYLTLSDSTNVLDQRHIGFGKTTEGLKLIDHTVRHGGVCFVVMRSYDNLREMYDRLSPDTRGRSVLFQGRPQPGMCNFSDEIETFRNIIPSLISCGSCGEHHCGYQVQKQRIRDLKADSTNDQGLVIFTVPDNLHPIIGEFFRSKRLTVIVDDIPLSDILWPGFQTTKGEIEKAIDFFTDMRPDSISLLLTLSEMLITESPSTTLQFVREHETEIKSQITALGRSLYEYCGMAGTQGVPSFHYLSHLLRASDIRINHPIKPSNIIIYNSQIDRIKRSRVIYINGTPTASDKSGMDLLDPDHQTLQKQAPPNDDLIVIQYRKAKYTHQSLMDSNVLPNLLVKLIQKVRPALEFIDTPLLFMTGGKAYEQRYKEILTKQMPNHEFVPFFSRNANSTNQFRNSPVLIIYGTPTKPPEAYIGPSYDSVRIENDQLTGAIRASKEKKAKTGHSDAVYPVPQEIVSDDTRGQVIQMTGRTHRNGDKRITSKLVVVLNQVDFSNESDYVDQTGAHVYYIDDEDGLVKSFNKWTKTVLEPLVMEKMYEIIEHERALGNEIGLNATCDEYSQRVAGIVSKRRMESLLRERYPLEEIVTNQKRKKLVIRGIKPKLEWTIKNSPDKWSNLGFGPIGFEFFNYSLYSNSSHTKFKKRAMLEIERTTRFYRLFSLAQPNLKIFASP